MLRFSLSLMMVVVSLTTGMQADGAEQNRTGSPEIGHQIVLYTYTYRLTGKSPTRGELPSREVSVIASDFANADFKMTLIQNSYAIEVGKNEVGVMTNRELISVK